ncbi:hypothetical protein P7D22_09715 [Lichenihabitans sp. Uapishka_5]|uniref:AAA family ATPase n=1 Tax=Lichenihabitans sp. Uapishka_5 TaxID=3037302 RepID=UPI0029E80E2C|nr:AAA family ATPase [Lichenihabitans sp. Uapishka_5]MDX7951445.1 hypothetical protein [Lichenihabitans sp. Uapishka_5]
MGGPRETSSVRDLLRPYSDVLVDATSSDAIGRGWRRVAADLFSAWARVLRGTPGARLSVKALTERAGGLSIVCDLEEGGPPADVDMTEVRRLQHAAEEVALRTCDRCGRRGILRVVSDGSFAVRCDQHADAVIPRVLRASSVMTGEIVENLLCSHGDWLVSDGAPTEVPKGWVGLLTDTLARLRRLPRGGAFRLLGMRAVFGRLEIRLEHDVEHLDLNQYLDWRAALFGLGDAALFTCDVCGAPGRVRPTDQGVPAPRCDAHDDYHRWPSVQWAAPTRNEDPLVVITSARPQWSVDALRTAAKPPATVTGPPPSRDALALYDVRDVATALGLANDEHGDPQGSNASPRDTEHQARLRRILERGDAGRWRRMAMPTRDMIDRLDALARRAPHLHELSSTLRRHLGAAMHMELPISIPPLLVLGEPGIGKTWYLTALSGVLGVPFRAHPMSGASHSDGVAGADPVFRNAQLGLVAKSLLGEEVANPLIFIDEFDKVPPLAGFDDLYRPYYGLLEPIGARRFVDAFLGFPIDASKTLWIFAANDLAGVPAPILSRLTVITARAPDAGQLVAVAESVYADANRQRRDFFPEEPSAALTASLVDMGPRSMRQAIEHAMTVAASEGRRDLRVADLPAPSSLSRPRMGFV